MTIAGLTTSELAGLMIDPDSKVTIPKASDFSSVTSQISYDLPADAPQGAIAQITYQWGQRKIGTAYLKLSLSPQAEDTAGADSSDMASGAPGSVLSGENDSNEDSFHSRCRIPYKGFWQSRRRFCQHAHRIVPPRHSQRSLFRTRPVMIHLLLPPSTFHPSYGSSWQFFSSAEPSLPSQSFSMPDMNRRRKKNAFSAGRNAWRGWRPAESVRKSLI